jgi:hypothetical protein
VCVRGLCEAAIRDDSDDCLVWWPDPAVGVTLRTRMVHTTTATITAMYGVERSGLMHAKPGLYHLPQDDAGRADLRASLDTLSDYVGDLVAAHLNIQRSRSGIYASGWQYFTTPFFEHMVLVVAG